MHKRARTNEESTIENTIDIVGLRDVARLDERKEEIENLILQIGLTQASKKLRISFNNLKLLCKDLKIKVEKKKAGRKKNITLF
jgi:hypothetical protein